MKNFLIPLIVAFCPMSVALAEKTARELELMRVSISQAPGDDQSFIVRFENRMEVPWKILRPLDGSQQGLHMPVYDLNVKDAQGKEMPFSLGCGLSGLYSNIKWPDDYRIQILPGDTYEMKLRLNREIPSSGKYSVTFSYTYDVNSGLRPPQKGIVYPEDLMGGTVTSDTIQVDLKQYPPQETKQAPVKE
ncbi:MAG: hypothetical protein EOP88_09605 [Verrucomicrobiaceae bacterium]|nr:MAG: hypothetical protein EOP88_09605 [Verrucomicrobiaceae bacterium]